MKDDLKEIYKAFGGKLVGNAQMKRNVGQTLANMPTDIVKLVTKNCWFMGSADDAWAFTFTGNDLRDQHQIFISDELLLQTESQILHSIAHEIGHVILNHRNSVLVRQTKAEIRKQEKEANQFAKKYAFLK